MTTYTDKHRQYYIENRVRILALRQERERRWIATPKGQYSVQKRKALSREIEWNLTFDKWWQIWQDSGHWEERGPQGYVMCRTNDTGPYAIGNVRIDTSSNNSKENVSLLLKDSKGRFVAKNE